MVLIVSATVFYSPSNVLANDHSLAVITLDTVAVLRKRPRLCDRLPSATLCGYTRIYTGTHLLRFRGDSARMTIMPQCL